MTHTTVIDAESLARRLADRDLVVVDCRFRLDDPGWGEREYLARHIPGAVYAHLDRDLSGTKTGSNGRHPLPAIDALAATLGSFGVDGGTQVVSYDQDNGMYASRLWWLLRWMGHEAAAVLDGGFREWLAKNRPTTADRPSPQPRTFVPRVRAAMVATLEEVAMASRQGHRRLVDARAPERFRGEAETIDKAAGHIPGATNHHFLKNLDASGAWQAPAALRAELQTVLDGTPPDQTIAYCGSGVTACHNLLAMEHAGLRGAKLYPGSWSEWSSDPARPIETGPGRPPRPR
jgi:thiosulfate/3-mercaptopyruvate sulfurtransferase